jgi:hypothetical protein
MVEVTPMTADIVAVVVVLIVTPMVVALVPGAPLIAVKANPEVGGVVRIVIANGPALAIAVAGRVGGGAGGQRACGGDRGEGAGDKGLFEKGHFEDIPEKPNLGDSGTGGVRRGSLAGLQDVAATWRTHAAPAVIR